MYFVLRTNHAKFAKETSANFRNISAQHGIGFILDQCILYLGLTMPNLQKKHLLIFEIFNIKECTLFFGTEYSFLNHFLSICYKKMTTSGQICKMSYTAYCNTYCNMGQPYCNMLFAVLFHPYKLRYFYTM